MVKNLLAKIYKGCDILVLPLFVKEDAPSYVKHDQLQKELIQTFFKEFLEAFFPEIHEQIDFQRIKPISEEVYTDLLQGETRRLDIVAETKLKQSDVVIIVHIEPQSYVQKNFNERMYQYFSLLYNKYRKPIVPLAVFTYEGSWEKSQYTMEFPFLKVLTFNYLTLHLRKINWRDFIRSNNPAAAALLSKMGFREEEKIEVKKEFLRMLTRMELDQAKQRSIYGFFETYLKLSEEEEERLMDEIKELPEADKILEIPISYEEKGKEIGMKIGKEVGKEIGKKEVAFEMLKEGLSLEFISKMTKISLEEIEKLKKKM